MKIAVVAVITLLILIIVWVLIEMTGWGDDDQW